VFLDDLKAFLTARGYTAIYRDTMPDQPDECIGLFVWDHTVPDINDGSGVRYVQIQVRCMDGDDANAAAHAIFALLDSGMDETKIWLTDDRWCIARPRRGPKKMSVDATGRVVYYTEVALWGSNDS
jgi:hypothetical protein